MARHIKGGSGLFGDIVVVLLIMSTGEGGDYEKSKTMV